MPACLVAISIDKVQTFLYHVIHDNTQEKQSNSNTLSTIIGASEMISNMLYQDIGLVGTQGEFSGVCDEILLKCSGFCVFTTSLDEQETKKRLGKLYASYYKRYHGQLMLKYICFTPQNTIDKLFAVKECKRRLKMKKCSNQIIEEQKELLFQFQTVYPVKYKKYDTSGFPLFSKNINDLFSMDDKDNSNHFRIAVIKADLDGMGSLLERIEDYKTYSEISKILSEHISLSFLHNQVEILKQDNEFRIYPFYLAGDDIFFAVPIQNLLIGIEICKRILQEMNKKISKKINSLGTETVSLLSMSIGIDFTFNREPIRYYYERVEKKLNIAKKSKNQQNSNKLQNPVLKLCMDNTVLLDCMSEKKGDSWNYFIKELYLLKQVMSQGFKAHHFFYGLLSKITNPEICSSDLKYSNAVLYHVIPKYLGDSNPKLKQGELQVLKMLLDTVKGKDDSSCKNLCFNQANRTKLEQKIRRLILFTDPRYDITAALKDNYEQKWDKKLIQSSVFNRPLRYLFEKNLKSHVKPQKLAVGMRDIFINYTSYVHPYKSNSSVKIYQTISLSSSMFHRIKKQGLDVEKNADMILAVNPRTKEEYDQLKFQCQLAKKPLPKLYFDAEKFRQLAAELWTKDYVDTLLIFYALNEASIRYKTIYSKKSR